MARKTWYNIWFVTITNGKMERNRIMVSVNGYPTASALYNAESKIKEKGKHDQVFIESYAKVIS